MNAANIRCMASEMLTIAKVDSPEETRVISAVSFGNWTKVKNYDPKIYRSDDKDIWQVVDENYIAEAKEVKALATHAIKMPAEMVTRVAGSEPTGVSTDDDKPAEQVGSEASEATEVPAEVKAEERAAEKAHKGEPVKPKSKGKH